MTDINSEVASIKGATPPVSEWLNEPYVGLVQIKAIHYSENHKDKKGNPYTGKPWLKYDVKTKDGRKASIIFWREIPGDNQTKNENKRNKLKKFFDSCEADTTKEGTEYLESIITKKVNVVFKKIDEIVEPKSAPPKIVTKIIYSFSQKVDEPIDIDMSQLLINLSEADLQRFNIISENYNKLNPVEEPKSAVDTNKGEEFKQTDNPNPVKEPQPQTEEPKTISAEEVEIDPPKSESGSEPEDELPY